MCGKVHVQGGSFEKMRGVSPYRTNTVPWVSVARFIRHLAVMAAKMDELQSAEAIPYNRFKQTEASRVVLRPFPSERVDQFLARVRPSMVATSSSTPWRWIWIDGPDNHNTTASVSPNDDIKQRCMNEVRSVVDAWSRRLPTLPATDVASEARKVSASLFALAKHYNYGSGKLLLSVPSSTVDAVWSAVAESTVAGKLGCGAKVSTQGKHQPHHIICVLVDCFWDEARVLRILEHLSTLGLHVSAFKPDLLSKLPRAYDLKALHLHTLLYNPAP
ncbi:hypothetical protein AeMF1_017631 [Aphanomyces euteiches]|nr:hypothetical protein AeMF1_017631 [Aphanomyces euteiches]